MKKTFLIILISITAFSQVQPYFVPKYPNEWGKVDSYIRSNWDSQLSKSSDLPAIFISAFGQAPFMFYWDTYYINKGLLSHDLDFIVRGNVTNLLDVVDRFGYMGNAAVTDWGMNRSQPPYLSQMVFDYFLYSNDTNFLRRSYPILKKEYLFWTDTSANSIENHKTTINGLQRFYAHPSRKEMVVMYEELADRFNLKKNISDDEKYSISFNYAVEAATGMDFTPRFEHRCPDFIAVDLNSLLYTYELNFDKITTLLRLKNEPNWLSLAEKRKELVNKYCWNETRGLYMDYDYKNKRHSKVAAITTFQPLWAGLASPEKAKRVVLNMPLFESEWGMKTTEQCGEIKNFQWGEISVWSPMQLLVVIGLDKYGYKTDAKRIAAKYLDLVARNFLYPVPETFVKNGKKEARTAGKIYEKYKFDGSINDDEYIAGEMMGWSSGSFAWLFEYLNK